MTSTLYDPGRQKSVIYPTGQSLTLSFDPAGRRTVMQEASGARSTYTYIAQYDGPIFLDGPEGLRTRFDYFGGQVQHSGGYISGGVQSLGQAFLFDAPGQVSALLTYHLNVPGFAGLGISYDPAGQVRQTTEAGSTRNYAYDAAGQLTGDQLINVVPFRLTYSYDPTGNRLTKLDGTARTTYVYDAANQLQTEAQGAAITTYSYDQNGNRSTQTIGSAITSFSWDEENRLTRIAYPDATLTTYMYSADGQVRGKVDSGGTVNYLWDESRLLQETDVSLVEIVRYTQGIEGWQTMSSQRRGGVDSFFAYDQIGNTRQLVDITGGVTDTTTYEAFGVERVRTGTTLTNVQFGGQFGYIRDLFGLSRAGARIVDSKTGQFITRDPIGRLGGTDNFYEYVGNDPVSGVDPSGLRRRKPRHPRKPRNNTVTLNYPRGYPMKPLELPYSNPNQAALIRALSKICPLDWSPPLDPCRFTSDTQLNNAGISPSIQQQIQDYAIALVPGCADRWCTLEVIPKLYILCRR